MHTTYEPQQKRDQHEQAVADCIDTASDNGFPRDMALRCSLTTMMGCRGCPHIPAELKRQAS